MDSVQRTQVPRVDVEPMPLSCLAKLMEVQLPKIIFLMYKMDTL